MPAFFVLIMTILLSHFSQAANLTNSPTNTKCPSLEVSGASNNLVVYLDSEIVAFTYLGHRRFYDSNISTWKNDQLKLIKDDFCSLGESNYGVCWSLYLETGLNCRYQ